MTPFFSFALNLVPCGLPLHHVVVCQIHIYIPKITLSSMLTQISFFYVKFASIWYITCFDPSFILLWPQSHRIKIFIPVRIYRYIWGFDLQSFVLWGNMCLQCYSMNFKFKMLLLEDQILPKVYKLNSVYSDCLFVVERGQQMKSTGNMHQHKYHSCQFSHSYLLKRRTFFLSFFSFSKGSLSRKAISYKSDSNIVAAFFLKITVLSSERVLSLKLYFFLKNESFAKSMIYVPRPVLSNIILPQKEKEFMNAVETTLLAKIKLFKFYS